MGKFDTGGAVGGGITGAKVGSAFGPVGTVIGGLGGAALGGFFGGGDEEQPRPDYGFMSAGNLYDWAQDYQSRYAYDPAKPYEGNLSQPMGGIENRTQSKLGQFIDQPTPGVLNKSAQYSSDVLDGKYDPRTSPYYESMKNQIMEDSKKAQDAILHKSAAAGMLHSDPRRTAEADLARQTSGDLSSLLGSLYEAERGRMGQAASQAVPTANALQNIPLQQIQAGSTIGAIPRQVGQEDLARQYNEYLRQVEGAREPLNIYEGLTGRQFANYDAQPYQTGGGLNQLLSTGMQLGSMFL